MKKIVFTVLIIAVIVTILSVPAYASGVLLHSPGDDGETNDTVTASWVNYFGYTSYHTFPQASPFTLIVNLYSGDSTTRVSILDSVEHYRIEDAEVSVSKLDFY